MKIKSEEYLIKEDIMTICKKLGNKKEFFAYILNNCEAFVEGNELPWYKIYMKLFLNCMRKKDVVYYKNIDDLRVAVNNEKENISLKKFEDELLNPNIKSISIEDIDLMNGFEFEDFLSKLFINMGYNVTTTKLSGDQGADLILERNVKKTVVQAKCYSGKISNKAVQEVVASIKHYNAELGMVVTNSYFSKSAINLADSNNIRLINRDKLSELILKYMN